MKKVIKNDKLKQKNNKLVKKTIIKRQTSEGKTQFCEKCQNKIKKSENSIQLDNWQKKCHKHVERPQKSVNSFIKGIKSKKKKRKEKRKEEVRKTNKLV